MRLLKAAGKQQFGLHRTLHRYVADIVSGNRATAILHRTNLRDGLGGDGRAVAGICRQRAGERKCAVAGNNERGSRIQLQRYAVTRR